MAEFAIRTEGLTRDFAAVRAVDSLSFEVPRGAVFGFLGPNGSGKTTTIRILLGLVEPSGGRAEVLGHDVRTGGDAIRERCGALLEHHGLYERFSAEDNLDLYGRIWRMNATARRARVRELLDKLGLWERRKENVGKWSRGMKQKLAVARALFHHPELIFLDEPTAGLDPIAAAALRDDLAHLAACEGTTVFLTTHNLNEADKLCNSVAVIREGRLLAIGSPDELRARTGSQQAEVVGRGFDAGTLAALRALPDVLDAHAANGHLTIDLSAGADVSNIVATLVGAGASVEEVRKGKASLEDVFLTLMEEDQQ
ncbi:MAG TPA: ABC transporter ATP-binding protein [Bryobacteraceae bacterium]|nr:ABC transporter ATP-binding protein [Bryobacteraceae bacterium]